MFAFMKRTMPDGFLKKMREHYTVSCYFGTDNQMSKYFNLSSYELTNERKIDEIRKVLELFPQIAEQVLSETTC